MPTIREELNKLAIEYECKKRKLENELEKRRALNIPEKVIDLAELLHEKFCLRDHTEDCDWFYDNGDWKNISRKKYLEKAVLLLEVVNYETALKVVAAIK